MWLIATSSFLHTPSETATRRTFLCMVKIHPNKTKVMEQRKKSKIKIGVYGIELDDEQDF